MRLIFWRRSSPNVNHQCSFHKRIQADLCSKSSSIASYLYNSRQVKCLSETQFLPMQNEDILPTSCGCLRIVKAQILESLKT